MGDIGVDQAHRQVGAALAGGFHAEAIETFEFHVPQPGHVDAIGYLAVGGDDQAIGAAVHHGQCFLPTGRVLGQQQANLAAAPMDGGIAAGDVIDALGGRNGFVEVHAEALHGRGDGLGGVAPVRAAGQRQVQRALGSGGDNAMLIDAPGRLRPAEFAAVGKRLNGIPVILGAHDVPAGTRAGDGIAEPAGAGRDPNDILSVVGHGGHEHVVAVGDDEHVWVSLHGAAQSPLDLINLAHAVELVAGEVEQNQRLRVQVLGYVGHVELVHLEYQVGGVLAGHECGDDAGIHVVTAVVGGYGVLGADCGGQHAGGGGLAVGAGNEHGRAPTAQVGHDGRVNGIGD